MQYITQSCRARAPRAFARHYLHTSRIFKEPTGFVAEAIGKHANPTRACRWQPTRRTTEGIATQERTLVELTGIEPVTPCLQSRCSPS